MKKQILFITFFITTVLFGITNTYAQDLDYLDGAPASNTPSTLTCASTADALHPLPGEKYTYTISTTPESVDAVHWFVTDESNVIAARTLTASRDAINGNYVLDAPAANYDASTNTAKSIDMSWKSFDGVSNQVLLVAYVTGASGCSDNIEVFRIEPTFAFTLDIAGLLDDGSLGAEECVSPVESATYDGTNLTMDYGQNYIYYTVNAANFVHSWMPTFTATGPAGTGTVEWAYQANAQTGGAWNAATVAVEAQDGSGAVGAGGECIVLRVLIDHGTNEIAGTDATVTVGVDGIMYDSSAKIYTNPDLRDLDEENPNCVNDVTDEADYTLKARPDINEVNPTPFVPKN